jgi:hypothetical protein
MNKQLQNVNIALMVFKINQLFVEIKVVLSEPTISNNINNDSD